MVTKAAAHFSAFLRRRVLTRETLWVLIVAAMILLIVILGTMGVQPRFVYSGF